MVRGQGGGWLGWRVVGVARGRRGVRGAWWASWWASWWFELRRAVLVLSWKMRKSARGEARAALAMKYGR